MYLRKLFGVGNDGEVSRRIDISARRLILSGTNKSLDQFDSKSMSVFVGRTSRHIRGGVVHILSTVGWLVRVVACESVGSQGVLDESIGELMLAVGSRSINLILLFGSESRGGRSEGNAGVVEHGGQSGGCS